MEINSQASSRKVIILCSLPPSTFCFMDFALHRQTGMSVMLTDSHTVPQKAVSGEEEGYLIGAGLRVKRRPQELCDC